MTAVRRAAIAVVVAEDRLDAFRPQLDGLLAEVPPEAVELRLAFVRSTNCLHYALGLLALDYQAPRHLDLPGGVGCFRWASSSGVPVALWQVPFPLGRAQALRRLWEDVPLHSEWLTLLPEGELPEAGWWRRIAGAFQEADYIGRSRWAEYGPSAVERIKAQPWFRGRPLAQREDRPGAAYFQGPVAVRMARLAEAGNLALDADRDVWGDEADATERLLGEMANQLGWAGRRDR